MNEGLKQMGLDWKDAGNRTKWSTFVARRSTGNSRNRFRVSQILDFSRVNFTAVSV